MLADKPLTALLDAFASPDPTPGGGSAAALAGALGASLVAMVAGLTKTRTGTAEERAALDVARAKILLGRDALVALVDRDAAAYDAVVAAYKLPKASDDEKAARAKAIQEALRLATEVPVETVLQCQAVAKAARPVAEHGNPSARTDLVVGIQAIGLAVESALLNVEANIGGLKDPEVVRAITTRLREGQHEMMETIHAISRAVGLAGMMGQVAQRTGLTQSVERSPEF